MFDSFLYFGGFMKEIAIITGANSGLGFETALEFAKKGITIIMACRNIQKATDAKNSILLQVKDAQLDIIKIDLSSLSSVREFVKTFREKYQKLNYLINNAGVMWPEYSKTVDGFENQMGSNYLGHFLLTSLLLDLMPDSSDSRVVTLSSLAHKWGKGVINFDDIHWEKKYSKTDAYAQSKLACLMFANELNNRLQEVGKKILSVSAHPGISSTELTRHLKPFQIKLMKYTGIEALVFQSAKRGALPTLMASFDETAKGGEYFGPQGCCEFKGKAGRAKKSKYSQNRENLKKLWTLSESLTKAEYIF
ncbi:SDR family NAD(P)-dependent oxidoreductase [bacterium]|nr:SDR family NAD(P)-dependent oxidoreductase [bacterium]